MIAAAGASIYPEDTWRAGLPGTSPETICAVNFFRTLGSLCLPEEFSSGDS